MTKMINELRQSLEACRRELQASEARFKNIITRNADGILVVDTEGLVRFANPAAEAITGRSTEDLEGETFGFPLIGDRATEVNILRQGGEQITAEMRVSDTRWEGEQCYLVSLRDITDRKQAQKDLQRSEKKYRSYIDNAPDGIFVADAQGRYVEANPAACQITGYSEEELLTMSVSDLVPPDAREEASEHFAQVKRTGKASGEFSFIKRDGSRGYWAVEAVQLSETRFLGFVKDITARREAEEDRRRLRDFLVSTLNALSAHIAVLDAEGTIVAVNEAWRRFADENQLGWPNYGVGRNYLAVCDAALGQASEGAQRAQQGIRDVMDGRREQFWMEYPCHGPEERRWFMMRVTRFRGDDGSSVVVAHESITERKEAEQKIKRYAADLERSNEELEQFAYVISHDLREPVRMVQSYLDLLKRRYQGQLDQKADKFIDYAVDSAERMQEMIRALLNLSRVETQGKDLTPTDVDLVLERTLKALRRAIEEADAEVTHDRLPTVQADAAQLGQVFQNLIANAIKFRREDVPPRIHISAERQGDEWLFSVTDNGIGIDAEHADRIFQVFQRLHTEEEYPGLGVGLALCKRIVERHGGRIWAEPGPGVGTTFYFTLPA
jgi:PAS domain S-box-containing protein